MLYYKLILLQFYPFSLSLLCQFCVNITNNPLDFHFLLFHLQNVITSIIILLAFGGGSVKAAIFPRTVSCLFFTNFCSLFLLLVLYCCCYYQLLLLLSYMFLSKIKNNNKPRRLQCVQHTSVSQGKNKMLRRHNLLHPSKDACKVFEKTL